MENFLNYTVGDSAAILSLFTVTEKKLKDIAGENWRLRQQLFVSTAENENNCEKLKITAKENDCLLKMITNYEESFKLWKKMEEENKSLKASLPEKERDYENRINSIRRQLTIEKEVSEKQSSKELAEAQDEITRVSAENKRLKATLNDMEQQHAKTIAEMNLECERRMVKLESEFATGARKTAVSSMQMSYCGTNEDSSRAFSAYQKKLEHLKSEYEQKIASLLNEIESLKGKLQLMSTADESNRPEVMTMNDTTLELTSVNAPMQHVSTPASKKAHVTTTTTTGIAKRSYDQSQMARSPAPAISPNTLQQPTVRAFGHHVQTALQSKATMKPCQPPLSSVKRDTKNKQQQNEMNVASTPIPPKRVTFASDSQVDIYEFADDD